MRERFTVAALVTLVFLLDSIALDLVKSGSAALQRADIGGYARLAVSLFQNLSFPILIALYAGSLAGIFVGAQVVLYIRSKLHSASGDHQQC